MFRILFFSAGNVGRSRMAASFARQWGADDCEVFFAYDDAHSIHPLTQKVMEELGEPFPTELTTPIDHFTTERFDLVITLTEQAKLKCPLFPGSPARIHWPIADQGDKDAPDVAANADSFRRIRDEVRHRVAHLFEFGIIDSLKEMRLIFTSLVDNLTDGVMAHDKDRQIYFFNPAAERITGYTLSEVIGRDCHQVFPGRFCGGDCPFCDEGDIHQTKLRYPRAFTRSSGEQRDLEMSVVPVHTPGKGFWGALVIFRDRTELLHLRRRLEQSSGFQGIIGRHISMQKLFDSIRELADVNVPILIQGESGTGKEMVAVALHQLSQRSSGPFVPVNCGALPEGTLESELFGHVRGAFTGAVHNRKGRFELAGGGTIFLDEIGEISPPMQVKLLRVLQDKSFIPVGGEKQISVNVRIICATNRDLKLLTQQGLYRDDLYYRLAVVPIHLPALRERVSDIPSLVDHFLARFTSDTGKQISGVSAQAMELLMRYTWPGNVRELSNAIQYGMIKCPGGVIRAEHLPPEIVRGDVRGISPRVGRPAKITEEELSEALRRTDGNRSKAARLLGVSRTTVHRLIKNSHPS